MAGIFGSVTNPIDKYGSVNGGLPKFVSNIITVIFVGAGLFAFFNLMFAGFSYITSNGDQKKLETALASINMSLTGLVIMVAAAAVTGIVSFILFGDATAILSPTIKGPGSF